MCNKRIAAINDISGLGKCSLTASLPIFSILGIEACPIPTAVLTNQTGFDSYYMEDLTAVFDKFTVEWIKRDITLNAIYTGFLTSEKQIASIENFIDSFKAINTFVLVDPVMADNGEMYSTYNKSLCKRISDLAFKADIVTPNLTEACIMLDENYSEYSCIVNSDEFEKTMFELARKITTKGPKTVVITGIKKTIDSQDYLYNFAVDVENNISTCVYNKAYANGFSGTGDILASIICALKVHNFKIDEALNIACSFIEKAVYHTYIHNGKYNDGIMFEPFLHELYTAFKENSNNDRYSI